jgi:hypothetical protein
MTEEGATREPEWPVCGRGGCIGARVEGQEACLSVSPEVLSVTRGVGDLLTK